MRRVGWGEGGLGGVEMAGGWGFGGEREVGGGRVWAWKGTAALVGSLGGRSGRGGAPAGGAARRGKRRAGRRARNHHGAMPRAALRSGGRPARACSSPLPRGSRAGRTSLAADAPLVAHHQPLLLAVLIQGVGCRGGGGGAGWGGAICGARCWSHKGRTTARTRGACPRRSSCPPQRAKHGAGREQQQARMC